MNNIRLLGKSIDLGKCPILLDYHPSDDWQNIWQVMDGEWEQKDGWLIGTERGNCGGILLSRQSFDCDVVLSFTAKSILPATRDINSLFCAEWDEVSNELKSSYITGINGWYEGKSGIERHPEDRIKAMTGMYEYDPGSEIQVVCGVSKGHAFMFIDGELVTELVDPDYLTGGRVGFSPFCTRIAVKDICVRKLVAQAREHEYSPEF